MPSPVFCPFPPPPLPRYCICYSWIQIANLLTSPSTIDVAANIKQNKLKYLVFLYIYIFWSHLNGKVTGVLITYYIYWSFIESKKVKSYLNKTVYIFFSLEKRNEKSVGKMVLITLN